MASSTFYSLLSILLVFFVVNAFATKLDDRCPKIKVKKGEILRTRESVDQGAKFLRKETDVKSAIECYHHCCNHPDCNLALMSYNSSAKTKQHRTDRTCFLFDCGLPSKCIYAPYEHYATIKFVGKVAKQSSIENVLGERRPFDNKPVSKPETDNNRDRCLPGEPVAMCLKNPCDTAFCSSNPLAFCRPNFCGVCNARFYDEDGNRVKCDDDENADLNTKPKVDKQDLLSAWEEYKSHVKKPQQGRPHVSSTSSRKHEEEQEQSFEDKLKQMTLRVNKKPKQKQWKLPKPTTEPHHRWREFIDNNPKYGKANKFTGSLWPQHQKTKTPPTKPTKPVQPKTHAKPTKSKPRTKATVPHLKPKTKPTTKHAKGGHAPHQVPKPDHNNNNRNVSDVVVIETSNVRIIENKAVLPLAIFLVIAILMLFVVALRLRIVKSRLRRKAFATDDADYLINGMYL